MTRARIKAILLAHGFRVPDGMTDLKPYVYEAVEAVLRETAAPEGWQMAPVEPTPEMAEVGAYSTGDKVKGRPVWKAPIDEQVAHVYRAMLAAAPTPPVAAPTCRDDGRCQYAIDSGAEGDGHCPPGKCVMPQVADGTMYYEQVKAEYRNDADVIPLYAHPPTLRLPEPMTDAEIIHSALHAALIPKDPRDAERMKVFARSIEAETLRRVEERNE